MMVQNDPGNLSRRGSFGLGWWFIFVVVFKRGAGYCKLMMTAA